MYIEKAVNNAEKTSVVVQAAVQSKDTTAELLWEDGDFDYHGNDAKYNIPFRVSHSYLFDDADPDIPHVVKFRIISEAGTMQEYDLRVILQITQTEMLNMMPKVIITVYGLVLQEQLTAYRLLSTIRTQADTL